jgi:hypothetical protein
MLFFIALVIQVNKGVFEGESQIFDAGGLVELHNPEGVIFLNTMTIDNIAQAWNPTVEDIGKAEEILTQCTSAQYPNIYAKLSLYRRQYVGFVDQQGDHIISIYAFITSDDDVSWKKGPILIFDGGESVFRTTIDLDEGTCSEILVNGVA